MIENGQFLAVFSSTHRVMKAENILKKCGLVILLIPAPRALSTDCGLAICYSSDLYNNVLLALTTENILPAVIYRKNSDSDYEPIWCSEDIKDADN